MNYYTSRFCAMNWNARQGELTDAQRSEKLVNLSTEVYQMQVELNHLLQEVTSKAVAQWEAAGGCKDCLGWGIVVTWATLDGRGYTETGTCPTCKGENPAGKQPGSKVDGWFTYGVPGNVSVEGLQGIKGTQAVQALANTYEIHMASLLRDIDEETENCIVERGKQVVVFKGRKVPKGTTGECFWIGDKGWGLNVGIRDASGNVHWTAASNVKVAA